MTPAPGEDRMKEIERRRAAGQLRVDDTDWIFARLRASEERRSHFEDLAAERTRYLDQAEARLREVEGSNAQCLDALQATAKDAIRFQDKLAQAEQRVAGLEEQIAKLRAIVQFIANEFEDPDSRHFMLGWFDENDVLAALTPPPLAP